jgi:hypothetical protein
MALGDDAVGGDGQDINDNSAYEHGGLENSCIPTVHVTCPEATNGSRALTP